MTLVNGQYSFRVRSTSLASTGAFTDEQFIRVDNQLLSSGGLFILTGILILLCIATAVGVTIYRRRGARIGDRPVLAESRQNLMNMEEPPANEELVTLEQDRPFEEVFY